MKRQPKKSFTLVIPPKSAPDAQQPAAGIGTQPATGSAPPTRPDLAAEIASQLGETKPWPRAQIRRILWALGGRQCRELLAKAQAVYVGEGMLVASGKRKRTLGGCFFALVYAEGKPKEGRELKRPEWKPRKRRDADQMKPADDELHQVVA